jgi:hypothetical protein
VSIADITDPASPVEVGGFCPDCLEPRSVKVVGDALYVLEEEGLDVFDLRDPVHPMLLGRYVTAGDGRDLAVVGGRAYIADSEAGVEEIDVSACQTLFANGFDSGRASAWSQRVP